MVVWREGGNDEREVGEGAEDKEEECGTESGRLRLLWRTRKKKKKKKKRSEGRNSGRKEINRVEGIR